MRYSNSNNRRTQDHMTTRQHVLQTSSCTPPLSSHVDSFEYRFAIQEMTSSYKTKYSKLCNNFFYCDYTCISTHILILYHASLRASLQVCLIPESAHGTNAASAQMAGLNVVYIPTDKNGMVSIDMFKEKVCALISAGCLNVCVGIADVLCVRDLS